MRFGLSDTVIKELQEVFRRHENIKKVLIFGCRSKGTYREGSDIDLAVVGSQILLSIYPLYDFRNYLYVSILTIEELRFIPL